MNRQYMQTMEPFRERLKRAAEYAGVDYSQTAIARSLGSFGPALPRVAAPAPAPKRAVKRAEPVAAGDWEEF